MEKTGSDKKGDPWTHGAREDMDMACYGEVHQCLGLGLCQGILYLAQPPALIKTEGPRPAWAWESKDWH